MMRVSDKEIGLISQCASVFSNYQGPFTLEQFVGHFADYLNRATGITKSEIYDGLKELIGEGIIVKKMTDQGLKYVHYKAAHAFPDFDGNAPKTYLEGKKMKITRSKLQKLIRESIRNFDTKTGKPLNKDALAMYRKRDQRSEEEFEDQYFGNADLIRNDLSKKYGQGVGDAVYTALNAYFSHPDADNGDLFSVYNIGSNSDELLFPDEKRSQNQLSQVTQSPISSRSEEDETDEEFNARLQQMIDMSDPKDAEFFRKQMR